MRAMVQFQKQQQASEGSNVKGLAGGEVEFKEKNAPLSLQRLASSSRGLRTPPGGAAARRGPAASVCFCTAHTNGTHQMHCSTLKSPE
jgi:hypothetical protein